MIVIKNSQKLKINYMAKVMIIFRKRIIIPGISNELPFLDIEIQVSLKKKNENLINRKENKILINE